MQGLVQKGNLEWSNDQNKLIKTVSLNFFQGKGRWKKTGFNNTFYHQNNAKEIICTCHDLKMI